MEKATQQVLNDLKSRGFDTSSLERQIQSDPLLNKAADNILGGGILRQQNYQRYMNDVRTKEQQIQEAAQKLATLHDASTTTTLPQETLDTITALENALIETGMFTEESVKAVSAIGRQPLIKTIENPNPNGGNNGNRNTQLNNDDRRKDVEVDLSGFIDEKTHRESLANMAFGGLATNLHINAAMEELKALGIPITRAKVDEFTEELKKSFSQGNADLDAIADKVFEVSKVREAKANEAIEARIKEETDKRVAEQLKESGAPNRVGRMLGKRGAVFSRKSPSFVDSTKTEGNNTNPYKDDKGNIDISKLPKNKEGDPLLFTARGSRDERVEKATNMFVDLEQQNANNPLYGD